MPELPEAEVVRRGLVAALVGRTVTRVEAPPGRVVRRNPSPHALADTLTGNRIHAVDRIGKFLVVRVDAPTAVVVHLGMSGQVSVGPGSGHRSRHTHVVIGFDDGDELRFVDPRTFGHVFVSSVDDAGLPRALAHLGIDPLGPRFTVGHLAGLAEGRASRLKPFLMDQRRIAGIGNIYSDEILWRARLRWDRPAGSLDRPAVAALRRATVTILGAAIDAGGSSLSDGQYVDVEGRSGRYQHQHRVYARGGPGLSAVSDAHRAGSLRWALHLLVPGVPIVSPHAADAVVRRHVWVAGRVQGVWFRQGTVQAAERLGVGGWVTNAPDGRVEAVFEGPSAAVDALVAWCRTGPLRARVQSVEVRDELVRGETSFRIA